MKSPLRYFRIKGLIVATLLVIGGVALVAIASNSTPTPLPVSPSAPFMRTIMERRGGKLPVFSFLDASVSTDRSDYHPGDVVHITGTGFAPGENVRLEVAYKPTGLKMFRPEMAGYASGHDPFYVAADGGGNFTADWLVEEDSLGQTLLLTADGQSSGLHAETVFSDSSIGSYDQCSNDLGDGYTTGDTGCRWINGNLNANNSTYHEGDSTVQRAWLTDFAPGSSHTITFQYGTTKAGKHAYDFLTTWNFSESWIVLADRCQDITGCGTASEMQFLIPDDPNVTNTIEPTGGADRQMTIRGGTITAISTPAIVSGTYAGDSETAITVTFTVGSSGSMCHTQQGNTLCDAALFFGAHIAETAKWQPFNGTTGATSIPGSPYHVSLAAIDGGSVGQRDNQMQANAVVPPTGVLTITKLTLGGFGTFGYTVSPTPSPLPASGTFNLTTSAATNPQSTSFAGVPAGVYRVTESSLPAGWTLNNLVCTGDTDGGNVINLASHYVDIDLDNAEGQNCTFTNILPDARIVLSPLTATNAVNSPHTITATITQNDQLNSGDPGGDGTTGFGPAPDGTLVTFSLLNNAAGATFVAGNTCTTSGGTGTCTVQINTSTAGGVDIHATTTFNVLGVSLTRATGDGLSGDGANVHKTYVDAQIDLSPLTATNEVNSPHTITATVQQDDGIPAAGGGDGVTGFGPAVGVLVNFSLSNNTAGATFVGAVSSCTTGAGGTCTVQINTSTAGGVDIHATTTFSVGGVSLTRSTGTGGLNSADAHKTYVDARIALSPLTATNNVGQPHTITATVQQNDGIPAAGGGDGVTGFGPAPNGTLVTFSLTNSAGATATFVGGVNTCNTAGGTGQCSVQINSPTAGHVVIHATTTFSVGGVSLARATADGHPGDSADAQKDYVAGSLTLVKRIVNDNGGTAVVAAFGITTTAGSLTFGSGAPDGANTLKYTSNTLTNLAPNTYTLHEGTLTGYSEGTWGCVGAAGTVNGNPQTGSVQVAANENVTCTITNNDIAPSLILDKIVVNNNGGTRTESEWTLTANGGAAGTLSGPGAAGSTDVQSGATFQAGTYALSESGPTDYNASGYTCSKNGGGFVAATSITLGLGDSGICRITNDDIAPRLKLVKVVVNNNGGTAVANDWDLTATGSGGFTELTPAAADATFRNVTAGVTYALSETGPGGYAASNFSCNGGTQGTNTILLPLAASVTCTITNDDIQPTIIIRKITDPLDDPTSFSFQTTGTGYVGFSISGVSAGGANLNTQHVDAGTYTAVEDIIPGWILTGVGAPGSTNCELLVSGSGTSVGTGDTATRTATISLGIGDTIRCTFENTRQGGVTRTQGFWATHPNIANVAWFGGTWNGATFPGVAGVTGIGDRQLCGREIDLGALMAGFWADISKDCNGTKRSKLDAARMTLLQQLLAAELNASAFGTVPIGGSGKFAEWEAAFCGTNLSAINTAKAEAAFFNESGDNGLFTPGTAANPKGAKALANFCFWNLPAGFANPLDPGETSK